MVTDDGGDDGDDDDGDDDDDDNGDDDDGDDDDGDDDGDGDDDDDDDGDGDDDDDVDAGNTQEALREFLQLRDHPHLSLCSAAAFIHARRRSESTEAVTELKRSGSAAGDRALYYAALFYWILDMKLKARACVKKMLKLSETSPEGLILKGWIVLTSDTEEDRPQALRYFNSGVQDTGDLFGLMGKMEFFMATQSEQCALDIADQIIASHPDFIPALLMKMKVFVSLRDWEQTEALAQRVLERDGRDLKALQMLTVIAAAKDGNMELVMLGHNPEILQMLTVFVRRVSSRTPEVICELGYLLSQQNKYKEAHKCYSAALKTDPKCTSALIGTVRCLLMCDHLEEAAHQLAFFCEVQESFGNTAEVPLLKALLGRKQSAGEETVMQLLEDATELHFSALRGLNYGVEYLQMLDLNFLLQIVCMHLESKQDFVLVPGQTPPFWLKHSNVIMETVVRAVPGMTVSCYYMAYVKFLLGETAQHFLKLCAEKDACVPEVHLLQARLHLSAGEHSSCLSCLEAAVSVSFQVRDRFQFNLLKSRALLRSGDLKNAIQCLKITVNMPGALRPSEGPQLFISDSERVSVYLELTEALRLNGEQHEAARVLQDAILRFKGTPDETRLMLANVDLALARDDVDAAVVMLQNILPTESTYVQAREKMARIYLERKHNEKLYITCYKEISEQLPGPHTRILLADAFMEIHRAVGYYETALETDTLDCLVSAELAELLLKLRRFEKAQQVLEKALEHEPNAQQLFVETHLNMSVCFLFYPQLLADTLFWKNQKEEAVKIYSSIMERNPDSFHAMAKFLHILRRTGKLDDVRSVFIACEQFSPLSVREPGYNYCKGLYFWHSWQVTEALLHLNKARGDVVWGEPAVDLMVRICLNPDRDVFGGEVLDKGPKHLRQKCKCFSVKCSVCLQVMLEASLLVTAQGFVQLKQIPRARNFLKRLSGMERSDTNTEDLENACLLLADMYIKTGKYTQVDKLLDSCIRHNESCSKAYEYRGLLMEREQRHSDAALQYEQAWKHSRRAHPAVGFRLAFNYLKCKNYTLAVDVCHQVLQQRPDYTQIQDELLTRAQLSLRL
uniref:Tetratricopeptide repeat domain 21A n=1 Tax=Cyprinus carpio TaxID=7962 RepID=A0A8C2HW90_CYPCA